MATSGSTTNKSITLLPGESFTLPPGATVIAVSGTLDSTCDDLPNPEALQCYSIQWEIEGPNSGSDAWENGVINSLVIGGTTTTVNANAYLNDDDGHAKVIGAFTAAGVFSGITTGLESVGDMNKFGVCFKSIPSIAADVYLVITSGDHTLAHFPARLRSGITEPPCNCAA